MTFSNDIKKVTAVGNGTATSFSFSPMVIYAENDLLVVHVNSSDNESTLVKGTDYSVSATLDGVNNATGSVVFPLGGSAFGTLQADEELVIKRVVGLTQTTVDLENQGGYSPEVQEKAFDLLYMGLLQVQEQVDRAVKVNLSSDTTPDDLIDSIETSEANAAASATAAQTAQTAAETAQTAAETAQTGAETAETGAIAAKNDAEAAVGNVLVSATDTTAGKLTDKLVVGDGITKSITSPSGDEGLQLAADYIDEAGAIAGTNTTKVMNPLRTKQAIDANTVFTEHYTSSQTNAAEDATATFAHGLSAEPTLIQVTGICKTAIDGFVVGDKVIFNNGLAATNSDQGYSMIKDATNIVLNVGSFLQGTIRPDNYAVVSIRSADFDIIVEAWV